MKKIVVISAVWCPSCLLLNKNLKVLKNELDIEIEKLDFDLDEDEVEKYNVGDKLPVVILENDNNEIGRLIGEKSYKELLEFVKEN